MSSRHCLLALLLTACAGPAADAPTGSGPAATLAGTTATASDGPTYGLGRPAGPQAIALVDTDVSPDATGLPEGRGSVAEGATLFQAQCANCHGANGEGMGKVYPALMASGPADMAAFARDPKLVRAIGNYWSHATSVFDYIRRAMPLTAPGSLTDDQVYALTAYLLAANDVIAKDATLDKAALTAVVMPARDRFVPDDRRGGPGVK